MDLEITHTFREGTRLTGIALNDRKTPKLLKGWRLSGIMGCYYLPRSTRRPVNHDRITATIETLEEAGHAVNVDIDDTTPDTAAQDHLAVAERKAERAGIRASRTVLADAPVLTAEAWRSYRRPSVSLGRARVLRLLAGN